MNLHGNVHAPSARNCRAEAEAQASGATADLLAAVGRAREEREASVVRALVGSP